MILHLILQYGKEVRKDMTWEGRENLYHQENRYIRTQLYKNIIHLSFQKYTSQNFPFISGKDPSSVALSRGITLFQKRQFSTTGKSLTLVHLSVSSRAVILPNIISLKTQHISLKIYSPVISL